MRNPLLLLILSCVFGCSKPPQKNTITVAASSTPQAEILLWAKPQLEKEGFSLKIQVVDDYNIPNRALVEKEVDANFFQHQPFLEEQIRQFHYPLCSLASIHIEPMGIYSKRVSSLAALPEKSVVTLPNDPTNEARALLLLEKEGFITLKTRNIYTTTLLDIESNPRQLLLKEMDASLMTRTLEEVDLAIIPTNYALLAGIDPSKEALVLEDKTSPYVNVIAIRCEDAGEPKLLALKKVMESDEMRHYLLTHYQGAITPAF